MTFQRKITLGQTIYKFKMSDDMIDKINKITGMDITFVTSAKCDEEALVLLKEFGLPFKNK